MKKNLKWKIALIVGSVIFSFIFLLPNMPFYKALPEGVRSYLPQKGFALGLDLKGGVHLVFEVQGQRAVEVTTERIGKRIDEILKKKGKQTEVKVQGTEIIVKSADEQTRKLIEDSFPNMDISVRGGLLVVSLSSQEIRRIEMNAVEQALETIRNRVDQFGVAEPDIHRQGNNEIVVQLPGYKDPKRAVKLIGKTAQLEFRLLDEEAPLASKLPSSIKPEEEEEFLQKIKDEIPEGDIVLFQRIVDHQTGEVRKRPYLLKKDVSLTGEFLSEARVAIDPRFNEPYVALTFNSAGAKIFEELTGANVGKRLAIVLDGNVYSAPVIRERISGGNAQITGSFSMEEAKDLAIVLRAGALPAPVRLLQNVTVGPSLGRDSIEAGKKAGMVAVFLVVVFMIFYYRLSGLVADLALVLNVILLLGAMAMLHATLTMPGIAGIILAIGMAVDSNVLMFERMREEYRAGKTPRAAVEAGYDKAFITIVDSHVTTLITAAVLFQFGTGPIKGFAVTLSLGVAINLFTALVGTKTVFDLILSKWQLRRLSI